MKAATAPVMAHPLAAMGLAIGLTLATLGALTGAFWLDGGDRFMALRLSKLAALPNDGVPRVLSIGNSVLMRATELPPVMEKLIAAQGPGAPRRVHWVPFERASADLSDILPVWPEVSRQRADLVVIEVKMLTEPFAERPVRPRFPPLFHRRFQSNLQIWLWGRLTGSSDPFEREIRRFDDRNRPRKFELPPVPKGFTWTAEGRAFVAEVVKVAPVLVVEVPRSQSLDRQMVEARRRLVQDFSAPPRVSFPRPPAAPPDEWTLDGGHYAQPARTVYAKWLSQQVAQALSERTHP